MKAVLRLAAVAAALFGNAALAPAWAAPGDAGDEPPFGHSYWIDPISRGEPAPLDIEIERDGEYFWRGQVDGHGGSVRLVAPTDTCAQIIVGSSPFHPNPLLEHSPPMQAELAVQIRYYAYTDWPARFQMEFSYRRPVAKPSDESCGSGVDIRTVSFSPQFTLEPGQTIILREFDGFRISVTRK